MGVCSVEFYLVPQPMDRQRRGNGRGWWEGVTVLSVAGKIGQGVISSSSKGKVSRGYWKTLESIGV